MDFGSGKETNERIQIYFEVNSKAEENGWKKESIAERMLHQFFFSVI